MQIKTILNSVHPIKGFVYERIRFIEAWGHRGLAVAVRPRSGTKAVCSGCGRPGPTYDALPTRRFRFVPLWGLVVYLVYAMRRVNCSTCGITVERVMRSRLEPLKTVARSVRDHRALILNWFAAQKEFSSGYSLIFTPNPRQARSRPAINGKPTAPQLRPVSGAGSSLLSLATVIPRAFRSLLWPFANPLPPVP